MACFVAIEDQVVRIVLLHAHNFKCDMTTPPPSMPMPIHIYALLETSWASKESHTRSTPVCMSSSLQIKQPQGTTQVSEGARGPGLYMSTWHSLHLMMNTNKPLIHSLSLLVSQGRRLCSQEKVVLCNKGTNSLHLTTVVLVK